ncbi:DUF86 domain-containing protein [Acetobacter suratthaniensis]|uniref:DUF86 domain-containing protein n=1 Tax=Acetobacter suratthaniensis TaxID=1502841 RepID=A0ABS3LNT1_9PROT|nr:DUF86 domain-containing protein [Acetobacter suratthaniensis]MBO1329031.1 DUF86 domain-containing protein [Acetobacter suratthaniensis]MCX2566948.1 DUF86 domain-containing protein [Acetobacter suratthaniensis]
MRDAQADAISFIGTMSRDEFLQDRRTQQAVVMSLIIIGEAASKIINAWPEIKDTHPDIPWGAMRGMRNRIAHGYFAVDYGMVWDTVRHALPSLEQQLNSLLVKIQKT